jgi:hypothetical protein
MAKILDRIDDSIAEFIAAQHVFFVATAPLSADGHVNLSPKGLDSFRILDPTTVAYLDLTGSGIETLAHVKENGRLVVMFCAFSGPPNIVRLHGRAEAIETDHGEFAELVTRFTEIPGARAIIRLRVSRVATSCGYAVPRFEYAEDRDTLSRWAEQKSDGGLTAYRDQKNAASIDGLPGLGVPKR